ncbi:MAG: hypothetical protein Q9216_002049 [Gyalolechia sp. 2 TL-2023]
MFSWPLGDLRERHRRRCEKALDKVRSHKRKSCNLCARSKVKCDLQIPACQRCKDRHSDCEYPLDSSATAVPQWHRDLAIPLSPNPASLVTLPEDLTSADVTTTNGRLGNVPGHMESMLVDDGINMDWEMGLNDGNAIGFWNTPAWNLTQAETDALFTSSVHNVPSSTLPGAIPSTTAGQPLGDSDVLASVAADYPLANMDNASLYGAPLSPISVTRSSLGAFLETRPASSNRNRKSTGKGPKTNNLSPPEIHVPADLHTTRPGVPDSPILRGSETVVFPTPGAPAVQAPRDKSRRVAVEATDAFPTPRSHSSSPPVMALEEGQSSDPFSFNEILKLICDYPKQMLRPNFWSPFVHHRHYRCSQGGLAEPIAIALCCVSASQQFVESSLPFLCNLINTERQRLVNEFPTKSENLEDAMASLHAMCIYQIETILVFRSQRSVKTQLSSAQLHHHFLLQMTRRLCQKHLEYLLSKDNTAIDWQTWATVETLRRTTFLVDMVNELSYHARALELVYYEPLHPSLVLDMPLPAPDSMWRALNEGEWAAARDASGWTGAGVFTLRDSTIGSDTGGSRADGRRSSSLEGKHNDAQPISNLIISSAKHVGQQQSQRFPAMPFKVTA